ncbi:MAG: hypothetical protein H7222_15300 [Methylotenera sp.]|nr:hypothetical protein [Oligoflexia bacterium]
MIKAYVIFGVLVGALLTYANGTGWSLLGSSSGQWDHSGPSARGGHHGGVGGMHGFYHK